jgi:hypothetical protein
MKKFLALSVLCVASLLPLSGAACENQNLQNLLNQDARVQLLDFNPSLDNVFRLNDLFARGLVGNNIVLRNRLIQDRLKTINGLNER